jgi:hypothetical protein
MNGQKEWYSAVELSQLKLPGLPGTGRGLREYPKRDGWQARQVKGKGGPGGLRTEYKLPQTLLSSLQERALQISHRRDGMSQRSELTPEQTLALAQELLKTMENLFPAKEFYGHEDALMLAYHASIGTRQLCGLLGVN